jgi:hypothetical protein
MPIARDTAIIIAKRMVKGILIKLFLPTFLAKNPALIIGKI